jgi:PncC family amidohydrolase
MTDALRGLAAQVGERLVARGESVSVAESSAGGLIAAALLATPGSSRFFVGGSVIYTGTARAALLDITPDMMNGLRPATEVYAALLAEAVRGKLGTTWALSETGAAGPDGNRYGDAPGHCCFAVTGPVQRTGTVATGSEERWGNMLAFAEAALQLLDQSLSPT